MGDNDESSSCESLLEGISNYFEQGNEESGEDFTNETDTELDMVINEELIRKSQEEIKRRMGSLKTLISGLKELVKNERELWRQEICEVIATQNHYMTHALCYANSYCCPEWNSTLDFEGLDRQRRICSGSKSDEDLQLIKYHSDLRTRRLNITNYHRNLAIENYKRKLLEVESMCNMELNRVKTSVQSLQTLQQVAAEWDLASGDNGNKIYQNKSSQSPNKSTEKEIKNNDQASTIESPKTIEI
ncbi:hypothetical protein WA026_016532 [Henosepilachna vigintioctopunctata]|uniref:Uncharacterized protein n=1 Tax=Henosepilachna vigintioctopunctata TaxID=420089 RepID=A0AAW1VDE1_9CUCU